MYFGLDDWYMVVLLKLRGIREDEKFRDRERKMMNLNFAHVIYERCL